MYLIKKKKNYYICLIKTQVFGSGKFQVCRKSRDLSSPIFSALDGQQRFNKMFANRLIENVVGNATTYLQNYCNHLTIITLIIN
jgi:hypothetical protein